MKEKITKKDLKKAVKITKYQIGEVRAWIKRPYI